MTRPILPPLVCLTLIACSTYSVATWNPEVRPGSGKKFAAFVQAQIDSIQQANPEADAQARVAKGDSAFLALQGYVPWIPGYAPDWKSLVEKHGMHLMVPECEVIYIDTQGTFCTLAGAYAELYNATLLSQLRGRRQ